MDEILNRHKFMEAPGGYIECSCGWPDRGQCDEHEVEHVVRELIDAGILRQGA